MWHTTSSSCPSAMGQSDSESNPSSDAAFLVESSLGSAGSRSLHLGFLSRSPELRLGLDHICTLRLPTDRVVFEWPDPVISASTSVATKPNSIVTPTRSPRSSSAPTSRCCSVPSCIPRKLLALMILHQLGSGTIRMLAPLSGLRRTKRAATGTSDGDEQGTSPRPSRLQVLLATARSRGALRQVTAAGSLSRTVLNRSRGMLAVKA